MSQMNGMGAYNPMAYQMLAQQFAQQLAAMNQGMGMGTGMGQMTAQQAPQAIAAAPVDLQRVDGMDGAKRFEMPTNSRVALFDSGEDVVIIKATDGTGFPSYRRARLDWIDENEEKTKCDCVTRQEFEDLKRKVEQYGKQSVSKSGKPGKPSDSGDPTD